MAMGTGADLQFGISSTDATDWVTPSTVDRFYPIEVGESLGLTNNYAADEGVYAGEMVEHDPGEVIASVGAGGETKFALKGSGFGRVLELGAGSKTIALHTGQTAVWDHTYTLGSLIGKIATIQKGIGKLPGTVDPFTYVNAKVAAIDIALDQSGIVKVTVTWLCREERSPDSTPASPSLATPVYVESPPFHYSGASVSLGSATADYITQLNVKLTNNLDEQRYMNGAGRIREPRFSDLRTVDGTIAGDFYDRSGYNAFANNTSLPLVVTLTGPQIASTGVNSSLAISVPNIKLRGETPKAGSRGVVSLSHPFVGRKQAGSSAITYTYVTGDAAA